VPFAVSRLKVALIIAVCSVAGGWIWSANGGSGVDAVLTTPGEVPYPSLDTNEVVVGNVLPDATLTDLEGGTYPLQSLIGTPMIINFWYSTCEPCRREIPAFAQAKSARNDIAFLGVNMNDSPEVAKAFGEQYDINYPIAFDVSGALIRDLGIVTAPSTIFVDAQGNIVDQVAGEISEEKLLALISEWFPA